MDELVDASCSLSYPPSQRLFEFVKSLKDSSTALLVVTSAEGLQQRFRRCFQKCIEVPIPNRAMRVSLFHHFLLNRNLADRLAKVLHYYFDKHHLGLRIITSSSSLS